MAEPELKLTYEDCISSGSPDECRGDVEYRMPLSPSGKAFPRCDKHWAERLDKEDSSFSWQSDIAPNWFDPANAGERWDEDY